MLKKIKIVRYKGFKAFSVVFGEHALLMGPNNAGKSTLINALRLCGAASKVAMRLKPTDVYRDLNKSVRGYPLALIPDDGYNFENIAHEFEDAESRLDLTFTSGAQMHMVWPVDDPPFFWVENEGASVSTAAQAKVVLSRIGLVPTLTPIDRQERVLGKDHLDKNVETKLASRHFRNNIRAVKNSSPEDYRELIAFMIENTPEITSIEIEDGFRDGNNWLDLYFCHPNSRVRKELFWAGDGLQIWLQILFHLWRTRAHRIIILDEPDVFLHPDLQRRLVRVVEGTGRQTVLASHAAEVASEATLSSLIWVDRSRAASKRIGDDAELEQLSALLGTAFNLSIARALRSRTALFVEGKDMKVLRTLARTVGANAFASEIDLAIVSIGGFSHWPSVEAFGWIKSQFLGAQVKVRVLLDRDYRSIESSEALVNRLAQSDVLAHVWKKKELENYLLVPAALSRVSGLGLEQIDEILAHVLSNLKAGVMGQVSGVAMENRSNGEHTATVIARASAQFEELWQDPERRLGVVPAKDVISGFNGVVRERGGRIVTATKLAQALRSSEIDSEMRDFLLMVDRDLA